MATKALEKSQKQEGYYEQLLTVNQTELACKNELFIAEILSVMFSSCKVAGEFNKEGLRKHEDKVQ